jgi:thiopurine S-methyltransferase
MWLWRKGHEVIGIEGIAKAIHEFAIESGIELTSQENLFDDNNNKDAKLDTSRIEQIKSFLTADHMMRILQTNFLTLDNPFIENSFDCVWDRAALVAIKPEDRLFYIESIKRLINTDNFRYLLVTVEFEAEHEEGREAGPPYSISEMQVHQLFGDFCIIRKLEEAFVEMSSAYIVPKGFKGTNVKEVVYLLQNNCPVHLLPPHPEEEY